MTEKELRKLKRADFLELLLAQGKEMAALQARLDEATEELTRLRATNEHLNAQDELIDELKGNLDSKNATIDALRQELKDLKATNPPSSASKRQTTKAKKAPAKKTPKTKRRKPSARINKLLDKLCRRGTR